MPDRKLSIAAPKVGTVVSGPPLLVPFGTPDAAVSDPETIRLRARCAQQRAVIAELTHQQRGIVVLIRAMVDQVLLEPVASAEARAILRTRIAALARTHDALVSGLGRTACLHRTVELALAPYGLDDRSARFLMHGPPVRLDAWRAMRLFKVLNELAIHASRQGVLGDPAGRVELTWQVVGRQGMRRLKLCWAERGGKPAPPARQGGRLGRIRRMMSIEPGEEIAFECDPAGMTCRLDLLTPSTRTKPGTR